MISGEYFEVGISEGKPATLAREGISLTLLTRGLSRIVNMDTMEVSERLAHLPRRLHFPDGSMFTTLQNEQLDNVLKSIGFIPKSSWINFFESGWRWTLLALLAIPALLIMLFTIGMPIVAAPLASMVPEEFKDELDLKIMVFFDKNLLIPSKLKPKRQAELAATFSRLSRFSPYENQQLLFRGGGFLGANALALPGGTIIFTDEIIELADKDGELLAVFAHEIGHVVNNHAMRNFIQSAGVTFVMGWMLGDLTMITDIILVGTPVLLQKLSYSRRFEHEADEYALMLLDYSGYSRSCFADMMEKLATQNDRDLDDYPSYLSSHPLPRERIAMSRSAQVCSDPPPESNRTSKVPDQQVKGKAVPLFDEVNISPPEIEPESVTGKVEENDRSEEVQ